MERAVTLSIKPILSVVTAKSRLPIILNVFPKTALLTDYDPLYITILSMRMYF